MSMFRPRSLRRPLLAALLAATLCVPALAAEMETASVNVDYGDLNLRSAKGVATLHRRLVTASRAVCGDAWTRDLTTVAAQRVCEAQAMGDARATFDRVVAAAQAGPSVTLASAADK